MHFHPKNLNGNPWFKPRFSIILLHTKPHFVYQNISQVFILLGTYNQSTTKTKVIFCSFSQHVHDTQVKWKPETFFGAFHFHLCYFIQLCWFFHLFMFVHESSTKRETIWNKRHQLWKTSTCFLGCFIYTFSLLISLSFTFQSSKLRNNFTIS